MAESLFSFSVLRIHREGKDSFFKLFPSEFKWSDRIALAVKQDEIFKVVVSDRWESPWCGR